MTYIPTGFAEVAFYFDIPGPRAGRSSVMTFGVSAAPTIADLGAAVIAYKDNVWEPLGTELGTMVKATMRDGVALIQSEFTIPGTHAGALPPPNVSLLVRKNTNEGGRKNRGRFYPPGLIYENTYDDSGRMSTGSQEDYNDAFGLFYDALDTAVGKMVILHEAEVLPTEVDSLLTQRVAATQRRRLR